MLDPRMGRLHSALASPLYIETMRASQRDLENAYRVALTDSALTFEELELLVAIVRQWLPTLSKLAKALEIDRARVRAMTAKLEERGLVEIHRTKRRSILTLSAHGISEVSHGIACCRIVDGERLATV